MQVETKMYACYNQLQPLLYTYSECTYNVYDFIDTYIIYVYTLYVCTYVRMYVCTYVRMYVTTYVRIYVCTYVRMGG